MDTVKISRPEHIPGDFKVVVCCSSCGEPIAFGKDIGERAIPENMRLANGAQPIAGSSIFVPCPQCDQSNSIGGMGKWRLIVDEF